MIETGVEIEVQGPGPDQGVARVQPYVARIAVGPQGREVGGDEPVVQVGGVNAGARAVPAERRGESAADESAASGVEPVQVDLLAQAQGRFEAQARPRLLPTGGAFPGVVEGDIAADQRRGAQGQEQVGFPWVVARLQGPPWR